LESFLELARFCGFYGAAGVVPFVGGGVGRCQVQTTTALSKQSEQRRVGRGRPFPVGVSVVVVVVPLLHFAMKSGNVKFFKKRRFTSMFCEMEAYSDRACRDPRIRRRNRILGLRRGAEVVDDGIRLHFHRGVLLLSRRHSQG